MSYTPPPGIASDLTRILGSEKVLNDAPALSAYSTDASIYRVPPAGIVLIQSVRDLRKVVEYAQTRGIPLTARSGGTNLTGNALGEGIILEFSGLNRVLEINREELWVRVQPGKVYAELNRDLEKHGLFFPPDPSSGDVCKIGGMLGNNAAGPHSLKYGATKDNVLEMQIIRSDSLPLLVRPYPIQSSAFQSLLQNDEMIRGLFSLIKSNKDLLLKKRLNVTKNSSGYNLFDMAFFLNQGIFDLTRLFTGSEGTLGFVTEAKLKLRPKPARTVTALIYFDSLDEVGAAVNDLNPHRPSAMELMDSTSLDMIGRKTFGIPPRAAAMLLVEFDEEPIEEKIQLIGKISRRFKLSGAVEIAREKEHTEALWKVRKAIFPALYRFHKNKKPINFVDDVVVPVSRLPELIKYLGDYFKDAKIPVAIYGHIGDGNAHVNPLMNLKDPSEFGKLAQISREIHSTVITRFNGSICGEHGDGRVRGEFLKDLYGEDIYDLFRTVKNIFDPNHILNPGIKLTSESFTANIDIERVSGTCASCGKCNAVCPVYNIRQDESNGPRGWLQIVTAPGFSHEKDGRAVEACINCKSCIPACPVGIDIPARILEKRTERPNPLAGKLFKLQSRSRLFEFGIKLAGRLQPYWDRPFPRRILDKLTRPFLRALGPGARLSPSIAIPRIVTRTLRERNSHLTEEKGGRGTVAYFHGCAANYLDDGVGQAVIDLLSKTGTPVVLPDQRCSGTPIETYGHRGILMENVKYNIRSLSRFETVITGCASCTFMLRDYPRLFPNGEDQEDARNLSQKVLHITEYLDQNGINLPSQGTKTPNKKVTYHSPCHLKAAGVVREPRDLIKKIPGVEFVEMRDSDRCAGGAGTYIVRDFEASEEIFKKKREGILDSKAEMVATGCPACMIRLKSGLNPKIRVLHIAQLLNEAMDTNPKT